MTKQMINRYIKSIFFIFALSSYSYSHCDIIAGTTILTIHGPMPIEKMNIGDYVIGYENNKLITNQVIQISTTQTNTIFNITTNQEVIHATKNQLFYDPCINKWIKAKNLTINNTLLTSDLEQCSCQNITISQQTTVVYKISTTSPHNFFISDAQILTHNIPPIAVGLAWAFGAGIKFAGISLGVLFGGTMVGVNLLNKHKKNSNSLRIQTVVLTKPEESYYSNDAQVPGMPTEKDGYHPPKNWNGKKVNNPNGSGAGWPDDKGHVWIPTGPGPKAHGGPHWDVQDPKTGRHRNILPGGRER